MAERRRAQEAQAATVLAAALACLRGPGVAREPREALTAGALARPTLKTMQTALHLLHLRIRGPARTKKELQHIYPVLEPGQAKEFKAAMQEWVRELGAAGQLQPDSVKYFVSAYQGSAAHRAVLLLLDLSTLALAKELGEGPHVALPDAELLRPCCSAVAGPPLQRAHRTAADAQRQLQARMDAVVAAMQRLKQLHAQAAGHMASGQAASGAAAAALAPRLPPLFAGSQAAAKRGELVSDLLAHGPSLTAQPEAVGPESWADLLAAGKGSAAAAAGAATPPPATARRLSNPAQEASNFAAEGMAADADVLTVHGVLVQRLAAAGTALQAAASHSGAAAGGAEMRAVLAEAAACRESLMLSVRQELAAARVRDEQQAAATGSIKGSLLQLLPPALSASNPVIEGMQMSQQAAAAADAEDASSAWSTTPDAADVRVLRRSMWRQLLQTSDGSSSGEGAAAEEAAAAGSPTAAGARPEGEARSPPLADILAPAAGSSSSKAPRVRPPAACATGSPSLEDLISHSSRGLDGPPLLASLGGLGSPQDEELSWQPSSGMQQQQRSRDRPQASGSPCMAESCASFSIAGGSGRLGAGGSRPMRLAVSPMQSAAASFMPQRPQRTPQRQAGAVQQPGKAAATAEPCLPLLPLCESLSPRAGSPVAPRPVDSDDDSSGSSKGGVSPLAPTRSWRQDVMKAAEAAAAGAASPASGTSSRRRAASVAFTPPRRLGDSPLPELPSRRPHRPASLAVSRGGDNTPVSRLQRVSGPAQPSPALHAATPAPSPALQPMQQQQQQRVQPSGRQGGHEESSPSSPQLLASCLKSKPLALSPFALTPSSPLAAQQQEQPWTLAAARSPSAPAAPAGSGDLGSPRGSAGRRRSAVITTSSPRASVHSLDAPSPAVPHRLASSGAAGSRGAGGSDLVSGLRAFDSPIATSLTSRPALQASRDSGRSMGTAGTAGGGGGSLDIAELQKRLLAINKSQGRR